VRERFGASWGIAETGAAGPSGNRYGDQPGHACLALSGATELVTTLETGSADRQANMRAFGAALLALLLGALDPASAA
jgi:nicotinamide-nucleotide amidase